MLPNNFENNIKESLENRRISPSEESWTILANKLEQKKVFPFKILLVAASLIGIILTLMLTFKNETSNIIKTEKLKSDTVSTPASKTKLLADTKEHPDSIKTNSKLEKLEKLPQFLAKTNFKTNTLKKELKNNKITSQNDVIKNRLDDKTNVNITKSKTKITPKSKIIDETETLLASANSTILLENKVKVSRLTNYNSLLEEAEIELEIDNSLKNKIYKTVVANYKSLSKTQKKQQ